MNASIHYITILPELILSVVGIIIMLADPFFDVPAGRSRKPLGWVAFFGTLAALASCFYQAALSDGSYSFFHMIRMDAFSVFFHVVVISVSALAVLSSLDYLETQGIKSGEYYALILFATVGMGLLSSAMELVMLFIALEISSISTYILAGYRRRFAASSESSLKYFLLGSFATAFFLYGIALIYGATGTTNISLIAQALHVHGHVSALVCLALVLMFVGMGFKVAAAPFTCGRPTSTKARPLPS
jgi:NADH-quinone oxidoreductase subunit N